jgi:hypothetical protein
MVKEFPQIELLGSQFISAPPRASQMLIKRSDYFGILPRLRRDPVRFRPQATPLKRSPVQQDWATGLPPVKAEAFDAAVAQLEILYRIFSVSLDEALELRRIGKTDQSCQAVCVIPALCARLAIRVECLLRTLGEHAKHFGVVPNTVPLQPDNFRGPREQHTAQMNEILSHVLLTQRSQFLHKVDALQEMVLGIRKQFCDAASDLASGASLEPSSDWRTLDDAHFDLNSCLREAIVVFKSFLVILPVEQLSSFQKSVDTQISSTPSTYVSPGQSRRMTLIEGQ